MATPILHREENIVACPIISITFDYAPGRPAFTPRGEYAPIDPPEPAEVSFVSAELIDGDGLSPTPAQVQEWAVDYLDTDDGYRDACDHGDTARYLDPDEAYERQRDDR